LLKIKIFNSRDNRNCSKIYKK